MKIIENFLDDDIFNELFNSINSPHTQWTVGEEKYAGNSLLYGIDYNEHQYDNIIEHHGFKKTENRFDMQNVIFLRDYHGIRQEHDQMSIIKNVQSYIDNTLNIKIPLRMKVNLGFCSDFNRVNGFHVDISHLDTIKYTTSILYINTNNGGTLLEDGTFIKSEANKFVMFDGNTQHAPVYQTDTKKRFVLNYNFIL